MNPIHARPFLAVATSAALALASVGPPIQTRPGGIYCCLALENSLNLTEARELDLNFEEPPLSAPDETVGEVVAPRFGPGWEAEFDAPLFLGKNLGPLVIRGLVVSQRVLLRVHTPEG